MLLQHKDGLVWLQKCDVRLYKTLISLFHIELILFPVFILKLQFGSFSYFGTLTTGWEIPHQHSLHVRPEQSSC